MNIRNTKDTCKTRLTRKLKDCWQTKAMIRNSVRVLTSLTRRAATVSLRRKLLEVTMAMELNKLKAA